MERPSGVFICQLQVFEDVCVGISDGGGLWFPGRLCFEPCRRALGVHTSERALSHARQSHLGVSTCVSRVCVCVCMRVGASVCVSVRLSLRFCVSVCLSLRFNAIWYIRLCDCRCVRLCICTFVPEILCICMFVPEIQCYLVYPFV